MTRPLLVLLLFLITASPLWADGLVRFIAPDSWQQDAELTDVFFLNPQLGWAVGAQGTILRTTDAGRHWQLLSTVPLPTNGRGALHERFQELQPIADVNRLQPVRCRLESVWFADENHGWIAGGYEVPYVGRTRGLLLRTKDGGATWQEIESLVLPRISQIRFKDRLTGWALGNKGSLYKTGIFQTNDGGNTWTSHGSGSFRNWKSGLLTESGFVLIDEDGKLARVANKGLEPCHNDGCHQDVVVAQTTQLVAVGDQGAISISQDSGRNWRRVTDESSGTITQCNLKSASTTNDKIWIAGDPGSVIFSIDKNSGDLTQHETPVQAPLNKIFFVDDAHGFAVGSLGTILSTTDGGISWKKQRGFDRIALLTLATSADAIPFETHAKYSNEQELITAHLAVHSNELQMKSIRQAVESNGAFALSSSMPGQKLNDSRQLALIVRMIRTLRPNVIVANVDFQFGNLVQRAVNAAADPTKYPEQLKQLGLSIWSPDQLAFQGAEGSIQLDPSELLTASGNLIEDQIAISRALAGLNFRPTKQVHLQVMSRGRTGPEPKSLFGTTQRYGKKPPRRKVIGKRGNLASIQRSGQKSAALKRFAAWEIENAQQALLWRKQIQRWIGFVPPETACIWLLQLAQEYFDQGKFEQAAMTTEFVVSRWPNHALGPAAMAWLAVYFQSSEFAMAKPNFDPFSAEGSVSQHSTDIGTTAISRIGNVEQSVWVPKALHEKYSEAETASDSEDAESQNERRFRVRRNKANRYLVRLRQHDPELALTPEFRFFESVLTKQQHGWTSVSNLMKQLGKQIDSLPIARAAKQEIQIAAPDRAQTFELIAKRTQTRPLLDGKPDDAIWKEIASSSGQIKHLANQVLKPNLDRFSVSYDNEFLYILSVHQKVKGHSYENQLGQTDQQDPDLSRRDRIQICIDTDRDYCTAGCFVVDCRGWAAESCLQSTGWNPDWFVANSEDEDSWTVEIAIPFEEALGVSPSPGDFWAMDIKRLSIHSTSLWDPLKQKVAPRAGFIAGTKPNPDRFQLLKFEP